MGTVKEGVVATQVSNTRANAEMLMKLLANPEMAKLLKSLALTMEG